MTTDNYKKLATIQAQRKVLEAQEAEIRTAILADMVDRDISTIANRWGKFTTSSRKVYTYTEAVARIIEKLKVTKVKEEQRGLATATVTTYLTYTPKKD